MPWREKTVEKTRTEFIAEALAGEKSMSQLCREYEITRKTGYKWLERAKNGESLADRSHKFHSHPQKTMPEIEALFLDTRRRHPAWGARKLKRYLENQGHSGLPAQSTICAIMKRHGMITPEESAAHTAFIRFEKSAPNLLWQMDFKGHIGLLNNMRCHPLTMLDDHARFALCVDAKAGESGEDVYPSMVRVFMENGLPAAILDDNGPPWGDSRGGITRFDVWLMQLGILPIHGRPLHPQTQGKAERFHKTLVDEIFKRELFHDLGAAQKRFDAWRYEYNFERPHNALELATPASRYHASERKMPAEIREPEYDSGRNLRRVNVKGYISVLSHRYFLSDSLAGKLLELKPLSETEVELFYGSFRVAKLDIDERLVTSRRIYHAAAHDNAPQENADCKDDSF